MTTNTWVMENMDATEDTTDTKNSGGTTPTGHLAPIVHLETLEGRVRKYVETCKEVMIKFQAGGDLNNEDEIAVQKLALFVDRFRTELKDYEKLGVPDESKSKVKELYELQCDADELLVILQANSKKVTNEDKSLNSNNTSSSRLPKLELGTFDGDLMNWRQFWTRFHSAVDSKRNISDGDKMTYLMGALKNEAKLAIAGLDETDQNYPIAIERLKERFGKPEHIIDAHYVALNSLVPAGNDIQKCRETLDKIEQHLRILETLGENTNGNNNLRSIIMNKFPDNINYDLKMAIKRTGYSVENIRRSLEDIISARETNYPTIKCLKRPIPEVTSFTTEALFSANQSISRRNLTGPVSPRSNQEFQVKKPKKECIYCQENHFNDECDRYRTLSDRKQKLNNRCFICLRQFHNAAACRLKKKPCFHCKECGHHCSLCPKRFKEKCEPTATYLSQVPSDTILQTLKANLYNDHISEATKGRILFDTGSQKTYISEELTKKLKLQPIENLCLTIYTFGQSRPKYISTQLVQVKVGMPNGEYIEINAHVIPNITRHIPSFHTIKQLIKEKFPDRIMAEDTVEDSPAELLIGNDQYHIFFSGRTEQVQSHLYIIESKLGWIASGKVDNLDNTEVLTFLTYVQGGREKGCRQFSVPDPPLQDDNIRQLWDLESIGVTEPLHIEEEEGVIKLFNDTTKFHDGRYHVKWPWAQYPSDLPVNYGMALGRLTGLLKRTDSNTLKLYDEVLRDQLKKGVIETIEESKLPSTHPVHYLPHHHVLQENKTTKLRIVYDASAKMKGHCSLNEYLFKGPLMLEELVTLLINFRTHPIGITADVEKAFLQVGLQKEDRDVTRFLWVKNTDKEPIGENLLQFRFCRVPFGIISSPYLLAATTRHHLALHHAGDGERIAKDLYVDNLVTGAADSLEAMKLYSTARTAFNEISMNIREWNSNSNTFLTQIPDDMKTKKEGPTSVLGLDWNPNSDVLKIAFNPELIHSNILTKREILRMVASVFDPCGFVAPLLLPARLFLQKLWIDKYHWDTTLPQERVDEWHREMAPLGHIKNVMLPRFYLNSKKAICTNDLQYELHCFTDASQDAYSAAVYLRCTSQDDFYTTLVMSRTKLTPVKQKNDITIPKLELLGVLIGSRLLKHIQHKLNLSVSRLFLWTDSQIVLGWLQSSKLLPPFVNKRVAEINRYLDITRRFVPSDQNPADVATRRLYTELPLLWYEGPVFLHRPINEWPQEHSMLMVVTEDTTQEQTGDAQPQIDISIQDNEGNERGESNTLSESEATVVDEENSHRPLSEKEEIKRIQREHFSCESNNKTTALTKSLGLFKDENGILRCKGRLQNADLPFDQKYPILLPKLDQFTQNIIKRTHEDNHHVGVSHTLTLLRKRFWIPQGRSRVEAVIKQCPMCVKYGGGPYKLPPMPPLPEERVRICTPFTYTGLDYLGPLTVINSDERQKRWICLFTCMATRAIRLEVVKNLTAEEFLLCLRRFVAAQGSPLLIISDNAAQFKLAAEIIQSPFVENHKIAWHFIPELSPWQGGFYERLVGLVKHCLRRSLDKALLTDNQLITVLKEIETVLNSRPLTPVGKELEHTLTPADFLANCGTHPMPIPEGTTSSGNITATKFELIEGWKRGQNLLLEFADMFKNQYLNRLRERSITLHKQHRVSTKREPKAGDIVQVWDGQSKSSHRAYWKIGKILELIRSHDGLVRTARIQLDTGVILNRSISHLYPLEMTDEPSSTDNCDPPEDSTEYDDPQNDLASNTSTDVDGCVLESSMPDQESETLSPMPAQAPDGDATCSENRPRRRAACLARDTIRGWTQLLITLNN